MEASDAVGDLTPAEVRARKYITISIPTPIYREVAEQMREQGFRSVTEYMVHATRARLERERNVRV